MRVTYSPQRSDTPVAYTFDGEKITATVDGSSDTWDLSQLQPGDRVTGSDTTLPYNPLVAAERTPAGELHVTLLHAYARGEPNHREPEDH